MVDDRKSFQDKTRDAVSKRSRDENLQAELLQVQKKLVEHSYSYSFTWLGLPIIRFPDDILVYQELIWETRPDVIVEIGIARGGSILLSSTLQYLIGKSGVTVGIDIDIREHNRKALESHPLFKDTILIEGDSVSKKVIDEVQEICKNSSRVVLVLDGNHTHHHVLQELVTYSEFLPIGSYIVLPDTVIEFLPKGFFSDRQWDVGNNPYTALQSFLQSNPNFEIDSYYSSKAALTETVRGYIKKIN